MKNRIIFIFVLLIIILLVGIYYIYNYRTSLIESQKINNEYKSYYNVQLLGTELVSIINKTEDVNEKYKTEKTSDNIYIENDTNSIKLYIKFKYKDDYTTIESENITNNGIDQFIKAYSTASFKCTEINYHENGNVKSLTFTETND